jgi:DNA primase
VSQAAEGLARLLDEAKHPPIEEVRPHFVQTGVERDLGRHLSPIQRLKEQIGDPYAFISQFVELDERGHGHCPIHPPDVHPSFAVDRQSGHWTCFHEVDPRTGRYLGGDAIEFFRRLRGLSYKDTLRELEALYPAP